MGLLDRVKEVITVDISEKISYGGNIIKLTGEMKANERAIKDLINKVGIRCVENHIYDKDSEYDDLFSRILELRESNKNLAEQIEKLKEEQAEENSKENAQANTEENMKVCGKCGKLNDEDASFCVYCGEPFGGEAADEEEVRGDTDVL